MNPPDLILARAAAAAASQYLIAGLAQAREVRSNQGKDLKLRADIEAEQVIFRRLRDGSAYPILSEENGADAGLRSDQVFWVVDPLDGTVNYSRGLPLACVSIGLWRGDEPLLGVVHDLASGHCYSGVVGTGAWCEGDVMQVSAVTEPAQGILTTGFPSSRDHGDASLTAFVRGVQGFKKVRLLGSAALSLAWLAAGRVDAYREDDIWLWDVAAGLALVKAAGGEIQVQAGKSPWQRCVRAANGRIPIQGW
ncbi:MAG: hypothetical protein JNK85_21175 [Verrucomicrobiales bacterium]|nr:hypothetical protein [Verrucomicrobiales bacterium]